MVGRKKSLVEGEDKTVKKGEATQFASEKGIGLKEMSYSSMTYNMGLRRMAPQKQHAWWQVFGIRSLHESEVWWSKFTGIMLFFIFTSETHPTRSFEMDDELD